MLPRRHARFGRVLRHPTIGPILLLCLCGTVVPWSAAGQVPAELDGPPNVRADSIYGHIDEWFELRTLDGERMQFSSFEGRVLFVNFWATWCAPCVQEMPTIVALAASVTDADVEFLLVTIDEDARAVRRFAEARDLAQFVYFRGWEPGTSSFPAGTVPATFIVSKDGTIVYQHHGSANWDVDSIRDLLLHEASG